MSETEDYREESEDYAVPAGGLPEDGDDFAGDEGMLELEIPEGNYPAGKIATAQDADLVAGNIKDGANVFGVIGEHAPLDGDNVLGTEGALEIAIPEANYPDGKTATARDADLTVGNIKSGVTIFGKLGTHAPLDGDDVSGNEGALVVSIPAANYPAGKETTAQDADLVAANIKDGVTIFGKLGTHAPLDGDNVSGNEGALVVSIPDANYPAGKETTAQDADLVAANIKDGVTIFGVEGTLEEATPREWIFDTIDTSDDGFIDVNTVHYAVVFASYGTNATGGDRDAWFRFDRIKIPSGATITEAFLRTKTRYTHLETLCKVNLYFVAADDPTWPSTRVIYDALSVGNAIAWNPVATSTVGDTEDTPELKTILQAVIDRAGWESGQAVMLLIKNDNSDTSAYRSVSSLDYDGGSERPMLHVKWTE